MQHNVVDHIALVFGVVEAERAAQVFRDDFRCMVVVTGLHMHGEGMPEKDSETERRILSLFGEHIQRQYLSQLLYINKRR